MPLFAAADIEQFAKILVPVVIGLIVLASQVLGAMKKQPPPGGGRRPEAPRPPQGKLTEEIDSFLREAREGKGGRDDGGQRPAPPSSQPTPGGRRPQSRRPQQRRVVDAQLAEPRPAPPAAKPVTRSASALDSTSISAMPTDRFAQETASLGAAVEKADEKIESHLHDVFDHQLSQIGSETTGDTAGMTAGNTAGKGTDDAAVGIAAGNTVAADLANDIRAVFAEPNDIRKAIVLSEILTPPTHRW